MTPLELPALAKDLSPAEWAGRLAVSIPGWRWMPGMLEDVSGWRWDGHSFVEQTLPGVRYPQAGNCISDVPEPLPDPDDPGTAGCLLALLGNERWRLHLDDVGEWSYWVHEPPQTHGTGHHIHVGESLGRAAIAAAAALGRWPGGGA